MGVSVPGLKNIKRRYFVLSTNGLAYHKEKGTDPIFRIRKECMLAVEKVDDAALGIPFTMQIVHSEGILYMCASNEPEQLEWCVGGLFCQGFGSSSVPPLFNPTQNQLQAHRAQALLLEQSPSQALLPPGKLFSAGAGALGGPCGV